jgi:hypothetical protein
VYRILVIANETAETQRLHEVVREAAGRPRSTVLVVAPSADRVGATRRALRSAAALASTGVDARGMVGDADPVRAASDALGLFPADEIIVGSDGDHGLVGDLAERYDGPIKHLVVARERQLAAA